MFERVLFCLNMFHILTYYHLLLVGMLCCTSYVDSENVIELVDKIGYKMCLRRCKLNSDCQSVRFTREKLQCELLKAHYDNEDKTPEELKNMSKVCNIDKLTVCNVQSVQLSSGKSVCIQKHQGYSNVALNKATQQSSSYFSHPSGHYAVDGYQPITGSGECSHSAHEPNPFLTIDLGDSYTIGWVSFYTRPDCCGVYYHDLQIRVGTTSIWEDMTVCGLFNETAQLGKTYGIQCITCLVGQFVTFKIVENFDGGTVKTNQLSLCEVSVFGM